MINKKRLEYFIERIYEEHLNAPAKENPIDNSGIMNLEFWQDFLSEYPQFEFKGIALRAINCSKETLIEEKLWHPGTSWSKTEEGNRKFREENLSDPYIVVESIVFGVDVGDFIDWIFVKFPEMEGEFINRFRVYRGEDEIVIISGGNGYEIKIEHGNPSEWYSPEEERKRKESIELSHILYNRVKKPF